MCQFCVQLILEEELMWYSDVCLSFDKFVRVVNVKLMRLKNNIEIKFEFVLCETNICVRMPYIYLTTIYRVSLIVIHKIASLYLTPIRDVIKPLVEYRNIPVWKPELGTKIEYYIKMIIGTDFECVYYICSSSLRLRNIQIRNLYPYV